MLFLYCVLLLCCVGLLVAGAVEQRRHYTSLDQIPVRVLVNGIRGKSSITRLCAGALRGGGLTTVAKTTGTAARFIHPDATEEPVYRKFGLANVVEQIGIVRRAATYRPDALVIECMAVMPALQEINQEKLIRSTIGVLCNVREDHLAEMGPTLDDVARSLSRSMPVGGVVVTAEKDRLHILQEEADKRNCRLVAVDPETVSDAELRGFSWFTFKENVAIALAVAELLGVERETALRGMWEAPPDPGVLSVERYLTPQGGRLRFANVFAANDPESTLMNVQQLLDLGAIRRPLSVVVNCRPDRVERNGQMGAIIPTLDPELVFLIGHPTKSAQDAIPASFKGRVVDLGGDKRDSGLLTESLLAELPPESSLVAIGNIHGQGELFLEHLADLLPDEEADAETGAEEPPSLHAPTGRTGPAQAPTGRTGPAQAPTGRTGPAQAPDRLDGPDRFDDFDDPAAVDGSTTLTLRLPRDTTHGQAIPAQPGPAQPGPDETGPRQPSAVPHSDTYSDAYADPYSGAHPDPYADMYAADPYSESRSDSRSVPGFDRTRYPL